MININSVVLVGRITKDPELRKTQSNTSVVQFTVAVNRRFRAEGQEKPEADFIGCLAWRQQAEFLSSYCRKGDLVSVEGRIQTRNYDDQTGKKVYVTEIVTEHVQIINREQRSQLPEPQAGPETQQNNQQYQAQNQAQYMQEQQPLVGEDERTMFGGYASRSGSSVDFAPEDLPFY